MVATNILTMIMTKQHNKDVGDSVKHHIDVAFVSVIDLVVVLVAVVFFVSFWLSSFWLDTVQLPLS